MSRQPSPDCVRPSFFFGRRHGRRLRPGRGRRLESLLPQLRLAIPAEGEALDPAALFKPAVVDVWLEIGFGGGEHLAAVAAANPEIGFIGCEPYVNGVANLLVLIDQFRLGNVRIFDDDARLVLSKLPEASLGRVALLFPDPWPKKRHASRRFVCSESLDSLARVLRDGAQLRIATDDPLLVRWTLAALIAHPEFEWLPRGSEDWRLRPADWPPTRYEQKAVARGARCTYLRVVRRARP
jgi:tRNA (guanine-N7-)-methyltransferase